MCWAAAVWSVFDEFRVVCSKCSHCCSALKRYLAVDMKEWLGYKALLYMWFSLNCFLRLLLLCKQSFFQEKQTTINKIKLKYVMRMQGLLDMSVRKAQCWYKLLIRTVCCLSQTHAEVTLAKADAALRQRESELARLRADHQAVRAELTAVKQGLSTSTERAEKLHEEGQVRIYDSWVQNIRYNVYGSWQYWIWCVFNVAYFCRSDQRPCPRRPGDW